LLLLDDNRFLSCDSGFQVIYCLLQLRARSAYYYGLVPKPAVRQTNSNKSNAVVGSLFRRVHIADIGAIINIVLAGNPLPNTHIAAAVDIQTGRTSHGRVVIAADIEKECVNTDGCVVVALGIAGKRTNTAGRVGAAGSVQIERPEAVAGV